MIWHSSELMHEVKKQICVSRVITQLSYFIAIVWHFPELPLKSFWVPSEWESCENSPFNWTIVFPEGLIHENSRQQQQFWDLCFFSKFSFSFKLEVHFVLLHYNPWTRWALGGALCMLVSLPFFPMCWQLVPQRQHWAGWTLLQTTAAALPSPFHARGTCLSELIKKSLIKDYCGLCHSRAPCSQALWNKLGLRDSPGQLLTLQLLALGKSFCLQETGGKIWH